MKKLNQKATSIIEAVVVLLIIVMWVVGMFAVYTASQKMANSTNHKVLAIQIAKEWIEAVRNIRDTNISLFNAAPEKCWNVNDYNIDCYNNSSTAKIIAWSYIIYKKANNRWYLDKKTITSDFSDWTYRTAYEVWLDDNWFFYQKPTVWWSTLIKLTPLFTREIKISYLKDNNTAWNKNDDKMVVHSLVQWIDNSSTKVHKVDLSVLLTNWKN